MTLRGRPRYRASAVKELGNAVPYRQRRFHTVWFGLVWFGLVWFDLGFWVGFVQLPLMTIKPISNVNNIETKTVTKHESVSCPTLNSRINTNQSTITNHRERGASDCLA